MGAEDNPPGERAGTVRPGGAGAAEDHGLELCLQELLRELKPRGETLVREFRKITGAETHGVTSPNPEAVGAPRSGPKSRQGSSVPSSPGGTGWRDQTEPFLGTGLVIKQGTGPQGGCPCVPRGGGRPHLLCSPTAPLKHLSSGPKQSPQDSWTVQTWQKESRLNFQMSSGLQTRSTFSHAFCSSAHPTAKPHSKSHMDCKETGSSVVLALFTLESSNGLSCERQSASQAPWWAP